MNGIIKRITNIGESIMYLIWTKSEGHGRTYTGEKYRNYANWKDLRVGDHVNGLKWKDKKRGIIDGDSPVELE